MYCFSTGWRQRVRQFLSTKTRGRKKHHPTRLHCESLECRQLLSASSAAMDPILPVSVADQAQGYAGPPGNVYHNTFHLHGSGNSHYPIPGAVLVQRDLEEAPRRVSN